MKEVRIRYLKAFRKLCDLLEEHDKPRTGNTMDHFMLWNILAAFRGPDRVPEHIYNIGVGEAQEVKERTTLRIRDWVRKFETMPLGEMPQRAVKYTYLEVKKICGRHFADHLLLAEQTIQKLDPKFQVFKDRLMSPLVNRVG